MAGIFAGCGETPAAKTDAAVTKVEAQKAAEPAKDAAPAEKKIKIGLSWFNLTSQYLALLKDNMMAYQKAKGLEGKVELVLLDAGSDSAKQNSQVDNLIAQKVDAIVMIPFDREQQVPAVQAAKKAGIPMIELCASTVAKDDRTSYVGSDDIVSGRLEMEYLAKERKTVTVLELKERKTVTVLELNSY